MARLIAVCSILVSLMNSPALSQSFDLKKLWEATRNAVVKIDVSGYDATGTPVPVQHGTGIIVRSSGVIITALHVVGHSGDWKLDPDGQRERTVSVTRLGSNGIPQRLGNATVMEEDALDIAILNIAAYGLPNIKLYEDLPDDFSQIAALPWDPDAPIAKGPILGQLINSPIANRLAMTVPVIAGNSGAAVFDHMGRIVGIITNQLGNSAALATPSFEIFRLLPPLPDVNPQPDLKSTVRSQTVDNEIPFSPVQADVGSPGDSKSKSNPKTANQGESAPLVPLTPAGCLDDSQVRALVYKFLVGENLEKTQRQQLYARWADINCYVRPIAVGTSKSSPQQQARAIRLLANAIINNSGIPGAPLYWQPDGGTKRDFSRPLPYIGGSDIQAIVELITSDDEVLGSEVLRFVKELPVDAIDGVITQKLAQIKTLSVVKREKVAVAACSLYYNRIVEWLNAQPGANKDTIRAAVQMDFDKGQAWAQDAFFTAKTAAPYRALILYGKGFVEREQQLNADLGKLSFTGMLNALKKTDLPYPSRFIHIAQAVAFVWNPGSATVSPAVSEITKLVSRADQLAPEGALKINAGQKYDLYAGPKTDYPLKVSLGPKEEGRLLLRLDNWVLVGARDKVGWINLPQTAYTAANASH
jgi:hypothetical protein